MLTQAAVLTGISKPLELMDLTIPKLKNGQVLVEVAYSGVCQSQLLEWRGKRGEDRFLPHTLGHEGSGIVRETSAAVRKVKPGDHVVLSWIKGTGHDVPQTIYLAGSRKIQSGAISTFMKYAVVSENRVTAISSALSLREAAMLGCAFPTGGGIIFNLAEITPRTNVAIFGLGGVGLSAVLAAAYKKARKIIAVDVVDRKLAQAKRLGASDLINAGKIDALAAIKRLTNGIGADVAIESAGRRQTMESVLAAVRPSGGLAVIAGNLPAGETIAVDPFELIRGKRIIGTWGGSTVPDRDIPIYAKLFSRGRLNLGALITHAFPLDRINDSLKQLEEGRVGRALIDMGLPC